MSPETIADLWVYSIVGLLSASIAYAAVRSATADVDLLTYDHLPFTRDIHKERREWAKMWAKLQKEINDTKRGLNYINWGLSERMDSLKLDFKEYFLKPLKMVSVPGLIVTAIIIIIKLCGYDVM